MYMYAFNCQLLHFFSFPSDHTDMIVIHLLSVSFLTPSKQRAVSCYSAGNKNSSVLHSEYMYVCVCVCVCACACVVACVVCLLFSALFSLSFFSVSSYSPSTRKVLCFIRLPMSSIEKIVIGECTHHG